MPKKGLANLLLSSDYNRSEVAVRYYHKTNPGRFPDTKEGKAAAKKQFWQDMRLDVGLLRQVVNDIHREQLIKIEELNNLTLVKEKEA